MQKPQTEKHIGTKHRKDGKNGHYFPYSLFAPPAHKRQITGITGITSILLFGKLDEEKGEMEDQWQLHENPSGMGKRLR